MQFFYNTKLCTQILCFMLVILLPCFGILIGIMYINFYLFEGFVLDSSLEIFNRQTSSQIKTFSLLSKQMIDQYQFRDYQRLESVNKIYQFTWNIDIKLQNIEQCENVKCVMGSQMRQLIQVRQLQQILKIANLFSVTWFMGDNSFDLVFAGNSQEKFMAIWPSQGVAKTHPDPQARPWYKLEYNQSNTSQLYSTHFTQPFIHLSLRTVTVSHTQTLYDKDFSRIGVVTIQLNFSTTFPSFLQNSTTIRGFILDENFFILERKEQDTSVSTFFDPNVTGFDDSNADILKAYIKNGQILQNCQQLNLKLLCLTDVQRQEYIVQAYILQKYNQTFILVFNPSYDLTVLHHRQHTLNQNLDSLIGAVLFQTIPLNIALLFFTILLIYLIANKISEITEQANAVVFKNNVDHFKMLQLQIFDIENKVSLNCLEKLEIAFVALNHKMIHNSKRNPQCQKMIEICDYWEKDKHIIIDLKSSINQLENKGFRLSKNIINKIVKESILNHLQKSKTTT